MSQQRTTAAVPCDWKAPRATSSEFAIVQQAYYIHMGACVCARRSCHQQVVSYRSAVHLYRQHFPNPWVRAALREGSEAENMRQPGAYSSCSEIKKRDLDLGRNISRKRTNQQMMSSILDQNTFFFLSKIHFFVFDHLPFVFAA